MADRAGVELGEEVVAFVVDEKTSVNSVCVLTLKSSSSFVSLSTAPISTLPFLFSSSSLSLMFKSCNNSSTLISCPKLDSADQSGISQVRANALNGMSESEAEECAASLNWGYRIGQRDSEMFATTRDYRFDRVTVTVMLGVVTRVDVG